MPPAAMLDLALCFLTPILTPAHPCEPLVDQEGPVEGIRFGRSVLALGDLNDDGQADFAVGAPTAAGAGRQAGLVLVLSGADRTVLQEWRGEERRVHFGHTLRSAGDVDGDGVADVLVGYEFGARTEVRSGKDGALLLHFDRNHQEVYVFGDADRDGRSDFLLNSGSVLEVRSGMGGELLAGKLFLYQDGRVFQVGDLDGDGLADILVSGKRDVLWFSGRDDKKPLESVRLFHPDQRKQISEQWHPALHSTDFTLVSAVGAGDLDGDGKGDLVLSLGHKHKAKVLGLSLRHATPLFEIDGQEDLGHALAFPGDLDGDGAPDVVVAGEISAFVVNLRAHSGVDGSVLWHESWDDRGATVGMSLSLLPGSVVGEAPTLLVGGSDWHWHGTVYRVGFTQAHDVVTGETRWRTDVDDVRPLGAETEEGSVYR